MSENNKIIVKESIVSVYKMILGFIPGGHISQELFDLRDRINQQKLTKFSELMIEAFEKVSEISFDSSNLTTEDFLFAFEAVVRKVVNTKSEYKLKRYANILLRQIYEKDDHEMFMKYLALTEEVSDTQIMILDAFSVHFKHHRGSIMTYLAIGKENKFFYAQNSFTMTNGQEIALADVDYLILDLVSKGLLNRTQVKSMLSMVDEYRISVIGQSFINFVKIYDSK